MSGGSNAPEWVNEEDPEEIGRCLHDTVTTLDASPYEANRRRAMVDDLGLFHGENITNLYQVSSYEGTLRYRQDLIAFNLCYGIINTILNRICSFRVRAQFLPNGGDHKADRQAREMTDASDAWAQRERYHDEASFSLRDCLTVGTATPKVYIEKVGGKSCIRIARFPAWEFMVDPGEGLYREPECLYHVTYLPVEMAAKKFEVDETTLRAYCTRPAEGTQVIYIRERDMVRVIDAYQRGPEGRRVVACGPKVVVEPWEYDGFPVPMQVFDEGEIGFWGDGAVKKLRAVQVELIKWQQQARDAHDLTSQQVWLTMEGEAAPQKINNATVRGFRYTNTPPEVINPPAMGAEMYQYYELLKAAGYELLGVSQFVAAGQKQPGINSGEAIRESTELQTDRLARLSQRWEDMRVQAAVWWRRFAKEIVASGERLTYNAVRRGRFYEVALDAEALGNETEIRVYPSSVFGQTVSGRVERAVELIDRQFVTKDQALKALDMPDLEPIVDITLAEQYAREAIVDGILEDGEYQTPPRQMDQVEMYKYAFKRYMLTLSDGSNYPKKNLGLLKRLLAVLEKRAKAAMAAQAALLNPQPPGPVGPPPGPGIGAPRPTPPMAAGETTATNAAAGQAALPKAA